MANKHIHIALVGGAPTPVYQGILYAKPDLVFLVCSETTHAVAENIKCQLPMMEDGDVIIYDLSDTDMTQMENVAREIAEIIPDDTDVSLNLSSGLKVWTLVFNNVFRELKPHALIFCMNQQGRVFNMLTGKADEQVQFDMETQFALLGHEVASYTPYSDYTDEDLQVLCQACLWGFRPKYHTAFFKLTEAFLKGYNKQSDTAYTHQIDADNTLTWLPDENRFTGCIAGEPFDLSSPHIWHIMLNTGWFEVYVAKLLSHYYPATDIRLNCLFKTKSNTDKNEVDVIVNTGQRLLFVECKTQVYDTTSVDKFATVVRNYGGLGSKSLFVTNSPMRADAKEKCDDMHITTFYTNHKELNQSEREELLGTLLKKLEKEWNTK